MLLALVGVAMIAIASGWTHHGRTAAPSGKLFFWSGKGLGIVNADGRGAKIVRKLGDVREVELSPVTGESD